jgi:hypothetical protein
MWLNQERALTAAAVAICVWQAAAGALSWESMCAVCGGASSTAQQACTVLHVAYACDGWEQCVSWMCKVPQGNDHFIVGWPCVSVLMGVALLLLVSRLHAAWLPTCPFPWQLLLAYAALVTAAHMRRSFVLMARQFCPGLCTCKHGLCACKR